jgi:hypothetical protein
MRFDFVSMFFFRLFYYAYWQPVEGMRRFAERRAQGKILLVPGE